MGLNRRDFIKTTGVGLGGLFLFGVFSDDILMARNLKKVPLKKQIGETTTICPYCGVGCSLIMAVENGKLVHIEGDPDSPINEGSLCSKGASLYQLANNEERVTVARHRSPGASSWTDINWDSAVSGISEKIKSTRDSDWIEKNSNGGIVNRTEAIASIGSVFLNNEEAYLLSKMLRSLGLVYIENEARICVSAGVAADTETVGRGPMSNHWIDFKNSDCFIFIGGNMAESFPVAFKWVVRAQEKGAKLIHVDTRFTRTSAKCNHYAQVRPGTDIAFMGGVIRYVMDDMDSNPENYNITYVREYTNASYLINPDFTGPTDTLDGLFSGWDGSKYDKSTWSYQKDADQADGIKKDPTLSDPSSVFQLLKKHYERYTDDKVVEITGTDKETFQEICRTYAATGKAGKAGAIVFSSSACQHSTGTQTVRTFGILQLLLGNLGVAGGGLNGITGASNGLGCTLQGLVNHWGPGAGSVRPPSGSEQSLDDYGATKGRFASILKAWWGDVDHNTSFNYFPKRDGDYSWQPLFKAIDNGVIKGLICWGMNPMVSGPNSEATKEALSKLDWILVVDLWETETATFWSTEAGSNPSDINTEVFFLPAAHALEKEGSICNTCRLNQWRYKGSDAPGDARSDLEIVNDLVIRLKGLYAGQSDKNAEAINKLTWDYGSPPDVRAVTREMNGYDLTTSKLLSSPGALKADGTTSCGNWLWCGMYTENGNMAARRETDDPSGIGLFPNWGWAWPLNRRIMYNRASVDLDGNPWDSEQPVLQWDSDNEKWLGDVADGGTAPINKGGGRPFIMKPEGRGYLFGPGRPDGPFPEHYEPWESPVSNPMSSQQNNPAIKIWETIAKGNAKDYPIVATTHRLIEHMHTGAVTRRIPWLIEAMPDMFIEMSNELAAEKGITNGDSVIVKSARGSIEAKALVTARIKPSQQSGIHHINLPWNWGYAGLSRGDSTNLLTARIGDPNTGIPEFRAFLCNVRRAD